MADQTPIPADDPTEAAIAAVVKALSRFEQPPYGDLQCSAARAAVVAIEAAAPILLAAGRTAAAADIRAKAEALDWYEGSGVWAQAIEIARGPVENGVGR